MPFLELILNHKEFVIILILLTALDIGFYYIKYLHSEISTLTSNNAVLQSNLTTSNNSIKILQASIDQQNKAVDNLKAEADARVQSHQVELAAANAKAETYRAQALDIIRLKPDSNNKCQAAQDLIKAEISRNVKK